jgi:outer membrane protein OmpA-like peptidoglycan-associated protein
MLLKAITVGVAVMLCAAPAAAQYRGTMELGMFGSFASFDNALSLDNGFGGGGRVGMYLDPRWSLEFEKAEMRASRPSGLKDVNVGIVAGRVVMTPVKVGRLSLLLGAGAGVSTETNFLHSYGVDALVGGKFRLSDKVALRVDGVWDWLANEDWKSYKSVRAGLTLYRHANRADRTVTNIIAAPLPPMIHDDSVSAAETRRLRARDAALSALRDSLSLVPSTNAATLATMEAQIRFAFDKSELTDSAKMLLDEKVAVFNSNPEMSIVLQGYTDVVGSDAYNMGLGSRRAQAAKDYIVGRGIAPSRVIIESKGERQQIPGSAGASGEAPNRRAIFRLLIAPDVIKRD